MREREREKDGGEEMGEREADLMPPSREDSVRVTYKNHILIA